MQACWPSKSAIAALDNFLKPSEDKIRLFSLRNEFPVEWHQLLNTESSTLNLSFDHERFPFLFNGKKIRITRFEFLLQIKRGAVYPIENEEISIPQTTAPDGSIVFPEESSSLRSDVSPIPGVPYVEINIPDEITIHPSSMPWHITVQGLTPKMKAIVGDLFIACHYVLDFK